MIEREHASSAVHSLEQILQKHGTSGTGLVLTRFGDRRQTSPGHDTASKWSGPKVSLGHRPLSQLTWRTVPERQLIPGKDHLARLTAGEDIECLLGLLQGEAVCHQV
jgi:hypothetical protein